MSTDFTVIMRVRHQFGDERRDFQSEALPDFNAPFVGAAEDFEFSCPNVDPSQDAILQFEHRGAAFYVDHPVLINGERLAGGVSAGPRGVNPDLPTWETRILLIRAGLLGEENTLRIESEISTTSGNYDNFTIDNVVVFFKTRSSPGPSPERA
jgi:hypothetical protein